MAFSSLAGPNKTVLDNGITCYKDPNTMDKLAEVAKQVEPSLWTGTGTTVDLPEDQWMDILLIVNWEMKFKAGNNKKYPLRAKGHEIVNTEFDRLHKQRCTVVDIWLLKKTSFYQSKIKPKQKNVFRANQIPKSLFERPRDIRGNARKKMAARTYITMLIDTEDLY